MTYAIFSHTEGNQQSLLTFSTETDDLVLRRLSFYRDDAGVYDNLNHKLFWKEVKTSKLSEEFILDLIGAEEPCERYSPRLCNSRVARAIGVNLVRSFSVDLIRGKGIQFRKEMVAAGLDGLRPLSISRDELFVQATLELEGEFPQSTPKVSFKLLGDLESTAQKKEFDRRVKDVQTYLRGRELVKVFATEEPTVLILALGPNSITLFDVLELGGVNLRLLPAFVRQQMLEFISRGLPQARRDGLLPPSTIAPVELSNQGLTDLGLGHFAELAYYSNKDVFLYEWGTPDNPAEILYQILEPTDTLYLRVLSELPETDSLNTSSFQVGVSGEDGDMVTGKIKASSSIIELDALIRVEVFLGDEFYAEPLSNIVTLPPSRNGYEMLDDEQLAGIDLSEWQHLTR